MKAVVIAAGDLHPADREVLAHADLIVAADGGATTLESIGLSPQLLVGDLDSADSALVDRLEAGGTRVERHPVDKEASDTELAVEAAFAAGASEVVLLGATGGERLDHELANLLLLADPRLAGRKVIAMRGATRIVAVHAGESLRLAGAVGDLVSLLSVTAEASGVTTEGLRWPLEGETLHLGSSRGLSNEVMARRASVGTQRGTLLVVETPARGAIG